MKIYYIKPVDKQSMSRLWFVDETGLKYVERMYTNYPNSKGGGTINKWEEFEYKEKEEIPVDFGGMLDMIEPNRSISVGDSTFKVRITHLPYLVSVLQNKDKSVKDALGTLWIFGVFRGVTVVISEANKDILLKHSLITLENSLEMIEGFSKEFDKKMKNIEGVIVKPRWNK